MILALIFVTGGKTTANADFEFAIKLHLFIEGADDLVLIDDVVNVIGNDITGSDDAFPLDFDRQDAWLLFVVAKFDFLQVQHDVGDIFHHARKAGEFVLHAGDADGSDGGTLE